MNYRVCSVLLAGLWLLGAMWRGGGVAEAVAPKFRHYELTKQVTVDVQRSGSAITIELTHPIDAPPSDQWIQTDYRGMLLVPDNAQPGIEVLEVEGLLYPRDKPALARTITLTKDSPTTVPVDIQQLVQYNYLGRLRDFHIGTLKADLMIRAKQGNELFMFQRVRVRLAFNAMPPVRNDAPVELPLMDRQLLELLTLNSNDWREMMAPARSLADLQPHLDWVERINTSPKPVLRMRVYEEGLYELTGEQIRAAGVDPALYTGNRVNIMRQGRAVPSLVNRAGNTLQRQSSILFYCPPLDRLSEPWAEFWLVEEAEVDAVRRIEFLGTLDRSETDTLTDAPNLIMVLREYFARNDYFPAMPNDAPNGMWFMETMNYLKPRTLEFSLEEPAEEGEATLTFYARLLQPRDATRLEFYINGRRVAEQDAQGLNVIKIQARAQASWLRNGVNELGLLMPESGKSPQAPKCMFIGFTIEYPRVLNQEGAGSILAQLSSDHSALSLPHAQIANLIAWEIDNPFGVRVAQGLRLAHSGSGIMLEASGQPRRVMLSRQNDARPVTNVRKVDRLSLLNESQQGDFLIVAHPILSGDCEPFAEWKHEQGFLPLIISVNDIYNHFGFGEKSDAALHRYLRYAAERWRNTPLQWVLLVGEASDYPVAEERAVDKNIQIDMVPTFGFGRPFERVKADSGYALLDGDSDLLPDLIISRIPAATPQQARDAFAKLIDFQREERLGPQLHRTMFLSDDEPEFEDILNQMILNTIPASVEPLKIYQREYPYKYYWRVFMRRQSPVATNKLIEALNSGLNSLLFFGHGGPNIWTGERLLHIRDLNELTNRDRLTFIVAATCNASWLDFPIEPGRHALGERFITLPDGGAYAMYAPTTGTTPSEHEYLMTYLYEALYSRKAPSVGTAMIYSKAFYASDRKNSFVLDQYILTGDPSWGAPPLRPDPLPLNVVPPAVNYYERSAIRLSGAVPNLRWGRVAIMVTWPAGETRVIEERLPVYNGAINYTLELPGDAPEGTYLLTVQGRDESTGEVVVAAQSLDLIKPDLRAMVAILPQKPVYDANEEIRVRLTLENRSSVPVNNLSYRVIVDDKDQKSGQINLAGNAASNQDATLRAQPGAHEISVVAEYTIEGDVVEVASASQVIAGAYPDGGARIFCRPEDVELIPESVAGGGAPRLKVRLRNLGRQDIDQLQVEVRNRERLTISQPVLVSRLPERGTKDVEVQLRDPLPMGFHPVQVLIKREQPLRRAPLDPLVLRSVNKTLRVVVGPDLEVHSDSLKFESQEFLVGQTVEVHGTVSNQGYVTSQQVKARAYRNKPNVPAYQLKPEFSVPDVTIPPLEPGESHEFVIRCDNTDVIGRQLVYVVIDPDQTGGESFWDNNVAFKPLVIKNPANFTLLRDLTLYSPEVISRQTEVAVSTVVENTGFWMSEEATFEVFELGVAGDRRLLFEERMLAPLAPGEQAAQEFVWRVDDRYPSIEININRLHDAAENKFDDNTMIIAPPYVISERTLAQSEAPPDVQAKRHFPLGPTLAWGRMERLFLRPDQALVFVRDGAAPDVERVYLDADQVRNPEVVSDTDDAVVELTDNFWHVSEGRLVAGPDEDPAPIRFAVPLPERFQSEYYDVFIIGQSVPEYQNFPSSYAEIRAEGGQTFQRIDMTQSPKPWGSDRMRIGMFAIEDGVFDFEVQKARTGVWTFLFSLEFEPYEAQYTSPVYHFSKPWLGQQRGRLLIEGDNLTVWAVALAVRCAEELESGQLVWTEWAPLPWEREGVGALFPLTGRYLQFQLRLKGAPSKEPVVRAVNFAAEF